MSIESHSMFLHYYRSVFNTASSNGDETADLDRHLLRLPQRVEVVHDRFTLVHLQQKNPDIHVYIGGTIPTCREKNESDVCCCAPVCACCHMSVDMPIFFESHDHDGTVTKNNERRQGAIRDTDRHIRLDFLHHIVVSTRRQAALCQRRERRNATLGRLHWTSSRAAVGAGARSV